MKNLSTLAILIATFAIFSADVSAENKIDDGFNCRTADSICNFQDSQQKLNRAIRLRNRHDLYRTQINNLGHKNRINQKQRHVVGRKLINVNQRSTKLERTGELEAPRYEDRKTHSDSRFSVSNNAKQNWRRAAINYYVDGEDGYTNREGMHEGVKLGSTHRIARVPTSSITRAAISKTSMRDEQKLMASISDNEVNKIATGKQRISTKAGQGKGRYSSQFQTYGIYDEYPNYLRTLRSLMNAYQAEKDELDQLYNSTEAENNLNEEEVEVKVETDIDEMLIPYEDAE